jgi:5-methylcytosine-specific restriction endonuclease McrA
MTLPDPENKELLKQGLKRCSKCGIIQSTENFFRNKNHSTGSHSHCIDCMKKYNSEHHAEAAARTRKHYRENGEIIREKRRDCHTRNREDENNKHKEWYQKNREQQNLISSNYYYSNQDYFKEYRQEHAERYLEHRKNRMGLIRANGGDLTIDQWHEIRNKYGNKCLCCGTTEKISLDHIIPVTKSGKHTAENVQPLCVSCNSRKGVKIIDYRPKEELCLSVNV